MYTPCSESSWANVEDHPSFDLRFGTMVIRNRSHAIHGHDEDTESVKDLRLRSYTFSNDEDSPADKRVDGFETAWRPNRSNSPNAVFLRPWILSTGLHVLGVAFGHAKLSRGDLHEW